MHQGRIWDALNEYEEAIQIRFEYPEAHLNRALGWLALGNFADGWKEYEWRWKLKDVQKRSLERPRWDGSDLQGRTLLVYAEQGLGDSLQFARYFSILKKKNGRILFDCPPALLPLMSRCPGIDRLIPQGSPGIEFDFQIPLLSLPGLLQTTVGTVPADTPYLFAKPPLVAQWRKKLAAVPGFKIGIAWQGSLKYKGDRHRSIPLKHFGALARIPGVQLVSLQKSEPGTRQIKEIGESFSLMELGPDFDEKNGAFEDTAAVMRCLDLVIGIDSSIVHLAGALGVPVWLPLTVAVDWRWLRLRDDSPWYPTIRLFRQTTFGDWPEVFERLAATVAKQLKTDAGGANIDQLREEEKRQEKARLNAIKSSKPEAAIRLYRHAMKIRADRAEDHNNLGVALANQNKLDAAIGCFEKACRLKPGFADAFNNRGLAELSLNHFAKAADSFRSATRLRAKQPEFANNLGVALQRQGKVKEALVEFDRAIDLKADYAEAHVNRARAHLLLGDLEHGFAELEWRLQIQGPRRALPGPAYTGEPVAGKTIVVYVDGRLEDALLLMRYVKHLQELGARVALRCPRGLGWLETCFHGLEPLRTADSMPAEVDYHAHLLSLPAICHTKLNSIPIGPPYLAADPARSQEWRRKLAAYPGRRVGLVWCGSSNSTSTDSREPLDLLAAKPGVDGIALLHLNPTAPDQEPPGVWNETPDKEATIRIKLGSDPWPELAAVMANLDLVIACDSPAAHLAGALGVPCWTFLTRTPDWCWMLERLDSPWYPGLRLFRQTEAEDWGPAVREVYAELGRLAAHDQPSGAINVPVAPGELIDKITILELKSSRIGDPAQLQNIRRELALLQAARDRFLAPSDELQRLTKELAAVNRELWDIEDELRRCEAEQDFGPRFVTLARSVYLGNDRRSDLKQRVNDLLGSEIREEKAYAHFQTGQIAEQG